MAEQASDPRRRAVQGGIVSHSLTAAGTAILRLIFSLVFSILIEWIGMVFWWPDEGVEHSRAMLAKEIGYLDSEFTRSMLTSDPVRLARDVADKTHYVFFEATRFVDLARWASASPKPSERGMRPALHAMYAPIAEFVIAMMQVTEVFSVRLAILTLAMPVFLLFSLVGLVDGLVQRDLRRWGGGRESSFVYHYAKKAMMPLVVMTWVSYLALPFSVHPVVIVVPFAMFFALSVAITASTFKKYL